MSKSVVGGEGGAGGHKVDVQFSALTFTVISKGTGNKFQILQGKVTSKGCARDLSCILLSSPCIVQGSQHPGP